jgi:hypothetical protein
MFGSIAMSSQVFADFLSDSKATLGMRNFYFNNDNRDGTAVPLKTEEWAQGFMLDVKSGYTDGTVGFGVDSIRWWLIPPQSWGLKYIVYE